MRVPQRALAIHSPHRLAPSPALRATRMPQSTATTRDAPATAATSAPMLTAQVNKHKQTPHFLHIQLVPNSVLAVLRARRLHARRATMVTSTAAAFVFVSATYLTHSVR